MSDADLGVRFGEAAAPSYVGNLTNYFTNMGTAFGGATQAMQSQFGSYTANIGSFTTRRKPPPVPAPATFISGPSGSLADEELNDRFNSCLRLRIMKYREAKALEASENFLKEAKQRAGSWQSYRFVRFFTHCCSSVKQTVVDEVKEQTLTARNVDYNPVMSECIQWIEQNYGSGVSNFFYQWRLLLMIDLWSFVICGLCLMLPWLMNPPANSTYSTWSESMGGGSNGTLWDRNNIDAWALFTLISGDGGESHPLLDSFMFTSGYTSTWSYHTYTAPDSDRQTEYRMDTAFTLATFASFIVFFFAIASKMNRNYLTSMFDSVVQRELAAKGKREKVLIETDQIFSISLLGGWDHQLCDEASIFLLSKSILVKLRTEIGAKKITFGCSVKMGVVLEYTPPQEGGRPKITSDGRHVPQQKPPTFQVHVCFGAKEAYEEAKWPNEDIDPYNIPDYGDAFISHMVYTDFESFPRVVATEEELRTFLDTSSVPEACAIVLDKGDYIARCKDFALTPVKDDRGEFVGEYERDENAADISFGYFETIVNMQSTLSDDWKAVCEETGMHPLLNYRAEVRNLFKEQNWDWDKYAAGAEGFTESDNQVEEYKETAPTIPPPTPAGLIMLEGQIFKSYGQGSLSLYRGFQPAAKVVDPSLGGQEIFGELIDETLERELREATNELPFAGRYDNVTKKILLLGEMDYMPSKVATILRHKKDNEPMYNMALGGKLETRASDCRAITNSTYEHGKYAPSFTSFLDPPFPINMMHSFDDVKKELVEFKNDVLSTGGKQSPEMKGVLHALEMMGHIENVYHIDTVIEKARTEMELHDGKLTKSTVEELNVSFRECYKFAKDEKSQDDVVFAELMANGQRNLKLLIETFEFKKLMATIKKYTWKLTREMETSTGDFAGTNGKFARFAQMILPAEWNESTLPVKRGPQDTLVPTYILPIPQVLAKGGEKSVWTLMLGVFLTIMLLGFTGFAVFALVNYEKELNAINSLVVPTALFCLKSVIPKLVEFSVKLEEWDDPEYEVRLIMLRTYFLKLANIFVLYNQLNTSGGGEGSAAERCSEAIGGMMFFQLIVSNSVLTAVSNVMSYGAFYYLNGRTQIRSEIVAQLYVDMNYNQALFLMGIVYVPALPITFFLLNWGEMYVLYLCMKHFCKLAEKPFEPKNKNSTYQYLIVTCGISMMTFALFLYNSPADTNERNLACGPWAYDRIRYKAVSEWFTLEMPSFITTAMEYILNPILVYVVVMFLAMLYTFTSASLNSVRNICVDTQWQLRALQNMLTRRVRAKNAAGMDKNDLEAKCDKLEDTAQRLKEEKEKYRKQRNQLRSHVRSMQNETEEKNKALQEVVDLNDRLEEQATALAKAKQEIEDLEGAKQALQDCLQASTATAASVPGARTSVGASSEGQD